MRDVKLQKDWKEALNSEFDKPYWEELTGFVRTQYASGKVYPPPSHIFHALELTPFNSVKIVIIGQDPYHGSNQANGLSFAVNDGISLPPSLQNIFKEIHQDLGITPLQSGDLSRWANQGVLMLNSVLTVAAGNPASHKDKGWEVFTDAVISSLNDKRENIVYLLWGKYAQNKGGIINRKRNLVLTSAHPSPYSVNLFFGNHHFTQANEYLIKNNIEPINWQ